MLPEPDRVRLMHMAEAARQVLDDMAGLERADLEKSGTVVRSVLRGLQVIGEAAARVSSETRDALPELPWRQMVGMRNRLVHVYWSVDLDMVWATVRVDLPRLLESVGAALGGRDGT